MRKEQSVAIQMLMVSLQYTANVVGYATMIASSIDNREKIIPLESVIKSLDEQNKQYQKAINEVLKEWEVSLPKKKK